MINKKSDLRGELLSNKVVGIVIAVICITILVYLLVKVYPISTEKQEKQKALADLERLITEAHKLVNIGDKSPKIEFLNTPEDWWFASYHKLPTMPHYERVLPEECSGETCICICKHESIFPPASPEQCTLKECRQEIFTIKYNLQVGTRGNYLRINTPTKGNEELFTSYIIEKIGEGYEIRMVGDYSLIPFLEHKDDVKFNPPISMKDLIIMQAPDLLSEESDKRTYDSIVGSFRYIMQQQGIPIDEVGLRISWREKDAVQEETLLWYTGTSTIMGGVSKLLGGDGMVEDYCGKTNSVKEILTQKNGDEIIVELCIWGDYPTDRYWGGR